MALLQRSVALQVRACVQPSLPLPLYYCIFHARLEGKRMTSDRNPNPSCRRGKRSETSAFFWHSVHSSSGHLMPICSMKQRSGSIVGGGLDLVALAILH